MVYKTDELRIVLILILKVIHAAPVKTSQQKSTKKEKKYNKLMEINRKITLFATTCTLNSELKLFLPVKLFI